jgi:hypothetical protein
VQEYYPKSIPFYALNQLWIDEKKVYLLEEGWRGCIVESAEVKVKLDFLPLFFFIKQFIPVPTDMS